MSNEDRSSGPKAAWARIQAPAITSPHAGAVLAAHCHQGATNDCAPFAAAMVLNGILGAGVDPVGLARGLDRPRPRGLAGILPLVRRVPGSATFPWGVVDAIRLHGRREGWRMDATWRAFAGRDALLSGLVQGDLLLPYIGGYRPRPWGHVVVLLAWQAGRGWGLADPQSPDAELTWISEARFRARRRAMAGILVRATLCAAPSRR